MNKNKLLIYLFFLICFSCSTLQNTKSDLKLYSEKNCAIVTGHPEATKIGAEILEKGGNAIDASLATQLALAVCFQELVILEEGDLWFTEKVVVKNIH